jgi:hypothetical protein
LLILDMGVQINGRKGNGRGNYDHHRIGNRQGYPAGWPTRAIHQAQHLIDKSHEHVVTAIALLRGDKASVTARH